MIRDWSKIIVNNKIVNNVMRFDSNIVLLHAVQSHREVLNAQDLVSTDKMRQYQ
jgi:hypothetical protein